ncbi:sugar transferase [Candidatus Chrysopegis kryptomonas]|uniref:sugar transferase n=1 Tax=Candidatus Chryseopegocella kryptomonas TaxID=1633643 RepID=UPI001F2EAEE7|nr:sugar transferase [Candidatus Chrysopegis kryptomonas]
MSAVLIKEVANIKDFSASSQFIFSLIFSLLLAFIFQWNALYRINVFSTRVPQLIRLLKSISIGLAIYVIVGFLSKFTLIYNSRLVFISFATLLISLFTLYRVILLPQFLKHFMNLKIFKRKCIIVGGGELGKRILNDITAKPELGLEIAGIVDDNITPGARILNGYKILGNVGDIIKICEEQNVDEIIIGIDNITHERLIKIIEEAKKTKCTVRLTSSIFKVIPNRLTTEYYIDFPTVTLTRGLYSEIYLIQKRIVDFAISLIALIFLSPFFLLIAVLIKMTSRGPVFYVHERVGKDGKRFKMYKFRTMYLDADKDKTRVEWMKKFIENGEHPDGETSSKKVVDKRKITPIGRILRKFSIDELPQLINVLKGEMSLVGPRPVLPYEYEMFKPWYYERNKVLPGCTGFWQVYGRAKTNFDDMVLMDIYYIQNMSPWLDLQIILKTIPVMLFGKGGG